MIISHKHKFIFWKPHKVASSSVLLSLGKHTGPHDVVGQPKNLEGHVGHGKNFKGSVQKLAQSQGITLRNHIFPDEIRKIVSKEVWDNYFKFTIIRNPWEVMVSGYWWNYRHGGANNPRGHTPALAPDLKNKKYIKMFSQKVRSRHTNCRYYFDNSGIPMANYYIRYSSLQEDYTHVCGILGIPHSELPKLKSSHKKGNKPYWEYFDNDTRDYVATRCTRTIEYFNYEFGK